MDKNYPDHFGKNLKIYIDFIEDIRRIYYRGNLIHKQTGRYELDLWVNMSSEERMEFHEWNKNTETESTILAIKEALEGARWGREPSLGDEEKRLARKRSFYESEIISQIKLLADKLNYSVLKSSIRTESEDTCDAWYSGEAMETGDIRILLRNK